MDDFMQKRMWFFIDANVERGIPVGDLISNRFTGVEKSIS